MTPRAVRLRLSEAWAFFRALCGDSAYEAYRERTVARGIAPLSRSEFYEDAMRRKYSRPNRCC